MKAILGKKIGMTQIFAETGEVIPVTVIEAGPEVVTQVKTVETDGYNAVQVGFEDQKAHRVNKPLTGHFAKSGVSAKKHLAEFRVEDGETYEVGQIITVADFEEGSKLDITGTSKGKGTQGNIKRHGHHRGPMTHGSKHKRLAGALAAFTLVTVYWSDEDFAGSALSALGEFFLAAMLVLLFVTAIVEYGGRHPMTFRDICAILVSGVAIPLSFGCLLLLRLMPDGGGLALIPLVAAFCSDSAALFTGMACGRHKLAPHVSPKKTVEGAIGGLAGGMLGMVIFRVIFYFCTVRALHIGWCIALGLLGAIMGQLGDLSFSLIKREFGIKDYGRLLPGHGGVLDRFDSVLFAAPVVWLVICHVPL